MKTPKKKIKAWAIIPNDSLAWWDINDIRVEIKGKMVATPFAVFKTHNQALKCQKKAREYDEERKVMRMKNKVVPCEIILNPPRGNIKDEKSIL